MNKVYLVGAGPGDPDLITWKGRRILAAADSILYDHLASAALLDLAPPGAERLYGWSEAEALTMNVRERIPPEERVDAMELLRQLSDDKVLEPYRARRLTSTGDVVAITITSTALVDADGLVYAIATTERPYALDS